MRAITIDMVGSALKKPAQTRVRNPVKSLSDLTPAQLAAAEKKADAAHAKLIDEMIEKGRGHERPTETRGKTDDLSKRFMASLNHASDISFEKRRRMEYHGSLRAVKRNPAKPAANPTKMPGKSKTDIEAVKEYVKFFGLKISPKPGSEPIIGTKDAEWYKVFDSWKQAREFFHRARTDHWDFGHAYPWDVKKNPTPKRARKNAPSDATDYEIQYKKPGGQWSRWTVLNYLGMAKQVAERVAQDQPTWALRVIEVPAR